MSKTIEGTATPVEENADKALIAHLEQTVSSLKDQLSGLARENKQLYKLVHLKEKRIQELELNTTNQAVLLDELQEQLQRKNAG